MITITKKYHFYAAHRNEMIHDKCRSLHGHTYHVEVSIKPPKADKTGVTMLFSDIDSIIEPIIKKLDHSLLMNSEDPLWKFIFMYVNEYNDAMNINLFPFPTSVENIAEWLVKEITRNSSLVIDTLSIRETESSTVTLG